MKLLASQKNELFRLLKEEGFKITDFEVTNAEQQGLRMGYTKISYEKNPEYHFTFRSTIAAAYRFIVETAPGKESIETSDGCDHFNEALGMFYEWTQNLKREVEAEITWRELIAEIDEEFDIEEEVGFFSEAEKKLVGDKIELLKSSIESLGLLQKEQLKLVNAKFDNLSEKMDELNKFDWKMYCLGTFTSIMIALSITAEQGRTLWNMFMEFISAQMKLK